MEIANIPVPIAAVLYQQFIFLTMTQLAGVSTVKVNSMTFLWDRLCLLQQNFITVKAVKAY